MKRSILTYISPTAREVLCLTFCFILISIGIRIIRSPELAIKAANVQLNVSSNTKKLKEASIELENQARIIEQKDRAYRELLTVYEASLKGQKGYGRLQRAIEDIKVIPEVENVERVVEDIEQVEENIELIPIE